MKVRSSGVSMPTLRAKSSAVARHSACASLGCAANCFSASLRRSWNAFAPRIAKKSPE